MGEFNKTPSINLKGAFTKKNTDWQEVSVEMQVPEFDLENYKTIQFDVYFEVKEAPNIKAAVGFNEKYDFEGGLEQLNVDFESYSYIAYCWCGF